MTQEKTFFTSAKFLASLCALPLRWALLGAVKRNLLRCPSYSVSVPTVKSSHSRPSRWRPSTVRRKMALLVAVSTTSGRMTEWKDQTGCRAVYKVRTKRVQLSPWWAMCILVEALWPNATGRPMHPLLHGSVRMKSKSGCSRCLYQRMS